MSKKSLRAIILIGGVIALGGMGAYSLIKAGGNRDELRQQMDITAEKSVKRWTGIADSYADVHQLIEKGEYQEAQDALKGYMKKEIDYGFKMKEALEMNKDLFSPPVVEGANTIIDKRIKRLENYLKEE